MTESPVEHDETVDLSHQHTKRDGETLLALGIFMLVLSIPVLVGTFFEPKFVPEGIINITAGLVLLGMAVGFMIRGRRMLRRLRDKEHV